MKSIKNTIKVLLLFLVLFPFIVNSQTKSGYTLSCTFKGLPDKTKGYLITQNQDTVQYAFSNGDQIVFKGNLTDDGCFHFIRFDTLVSSVVTKAIFVTNNDISIKGAVGKREVDIIGSNEQNEFYEIQKIGASFGARFKDVNDEFQLKARLLQDSSSLTNMEREREINKLSEETTKKNDKIKLDFNMSLKEWLLNHRQSLFAPYVFREYLSSIHLKDRDEVYYSLSKSTKDSHYGKLLKLDIEASGVRMNSLIPDFTVKNTNGEMENIHKIIEQNKITIIDCWASWCKPCRAETPKLKMIYEKYKSKGLNIVGVSSDQNESDWRKAVLEDKTVWKHFIEVSGTLSKSFGIQAIPAYILVDSEGKMLAFDCAMSSVTNFGGSLRGEALDKRLEELLDK